MKNFILHNDFGEIICAGQCQDDDFELQAKPGLTLIEGVAFPHMNYVDDDAFIRMKPNRPSSAHTFDWPSKTWVDLRTLDDLKAVHWGVIKAARAAAITSPLPTPYGTFDADSAAAMSITKAVLLAQTLATAGEPVSISFTLANNTVVSLNAAQMTNVGLLLGAQEQAARAKATSLRDLIDAAQTIEQLQAVVW